MTNKGCSGLTIPKLACALQKALGAGPLAPVVCAPTGPYYRLFEESLAGKFPLLKVNPLQPRRFAQGEPLMRDWFKHDGERNPRDDRYAGCLRSRPHRVALMLGPDAPMPQNTSFIRALQVARAALIQQQSRLRNRAHVHKNAVLTRQTKTRLRLV